MSLEPARAPDLRAALEADTLALLERAGRLAEERKTGLYLVGGLVRDLFLGVGAVDLDLAVEGDGPAFARRLADDLGGEVEVYERFLTATVTCPDLTRLDVATARTETYERPGALPRIKPAGIEEDLQRRDVSINAMAVALRPARFGALVDPFGGAADAAARLIRLLHAGSLTDDPTRILRMARYAARFEFALEPRTREWLQTALAAKVLEFVSGDRLRQEAYLALHEAEPAAVFAWLKEAGALDAIAPGADPGGEFPRLIEDATRFLALVEKGAGWEPGLVGLLLLLRAASPGDVARTVARLALAGKPREALARAPELAGLAARLEAASRPSEARTILAGLPLEAAVAALILAPGERARRLAVEYLSIGRFVRAELDGHDLAELGFAPGPVVGRILAALLDAKLDGEVADRPAEEAWVQARYRPPHGEALS